MSVNIIGMRNRKVKALITAAGKGRRFGAVTRATNKCLLHVNGEPLIHHILKRFKKLGMRDIYIVTGYQAHRIERCLDRQARSIYNPFYDVSGILGSFWAARTSLSGHPFVFTTSDHYFQSKVLRDCCRPNTHIRIVVQKKRSYTKEDAKVIIRKSRVTQIGKSLPVREAHGEFGGMVYFSGKASRHFFEELEAHLEHEGLHGYMMEILVKISQKYSMPITYSLCGEDDRIEVDSVPDLIQARHIASRFKNTK